MAQQASGGIVGNNRGQIFYVYNISEEIKSNGIIAGGIAGNQNTNSNAYIKYAYNTSKIIADDNVSGIANIATGTVSYTYNIGELEATNGTKKGQISSVEVSKVSNSSGTTKEIMTAWNQNEITNNLQKFVKKENNLPILNITVGNITF